MPAVGVLTVCSARSPSGTAEVRASRLDSCLDTFHGCVLPVRAAVAFRRSPADRRARADSRSAVRVRKSDQHRAERWSLARPHRGAVIATPPLTSTQLAPRCQSPGPVLVLRFTQCSGGPANLPHFGYQLNARVGHTIEPARLGSTKRLGLAHMSLFRTGLWPLGDESLESTKQSQLQLAPC